jgi:hypothetical protein
MLIPRQFGEHELIFQIEHPFIPDPQTGALIESEKWMVTIHRGTVSWFSGGVLLDNATKRTGSFDSAATALKAGIDFAYHCGLED